MKEVTLSFLVAIGAVFLFFFSFLVMVVLYEAGRLRRAFIVAATSVLLVGETRIDVDEEDYRKYQQEHES